MLQDHHRLNVSPTIDTVLSSIPYSNPRVGPLVTNLEAALNYLFASIFPHYIGQFATPNDLPPMADANDYAFVVDDGDGKSSGYVYVDVDGVAGWEKKYDVDWSMDTLLSDVLGQTHPLYVFLNGRPGGQHIYGGSVSGENLQLNANSADDTGEIITHNHIRPYTDNTDDIGKLTERLRDLFIAGSLKDGTDSITVAQLKIAFDHISLTDNPHSVGYDQLNDKLQTATFEGGVTGSVDLSSSGNKTIDLNVVDDSHNHSKSTLPGFDTNVYEKVKSILQSADGISFTANDGAETITPAQADIDTSEITDIDAPQVHRLLGGSLDGSKWTPLQPTITITGKAQGDATFSGVTPGWNLDVTSVLTTLKTLEDVNLLSKEISSIVSGNPTTLIINSHGLANGEKLRVKSLATDTSPSIIDQSFAVTVIDANTVTIPVSTTGGDGPGKYIPQGGQLLYNPETDMWDLAKEYEQIYLSELSGLSQDVLTQYLLLAGRAGSQTIHGGAASGEHLYLESTSDATKGKVYTRDTLAPSIDANYSGSWTGKDLGEPTKRFKDLYLAGEAKGLRFENLTSLPSPSGQNKGRVVYKSDEDKLYYDNGIIFKPLSSSTIPTSLVVFTAELSKAVDLTSVLETDKTTSDYGWALMDSTTSERLPAVITRSTSKTLSISLEVPVTGSFYIKGI